MGSYHKKITLALAAASANNIAQSQTPSGAGNLTLNGSAVSGGVATLDVARRVLLTFAANETGHNFVITGTDRYGRVQSETLAGTTAGTVYTVKDYLTITSVSISAAAAGAIQVGTNAIGSSAPMIIDRFIAADNISVGGETSGTVTWSVEVAYIDLASVAWDVNNNPPVWYPPSNTANLTTQTGNKNDVIVMPVTMVRLTNTSGTGTSTIRVNVPMRFA